jgi:hypothetical protein
LLIQRKKGHAMIYEKHDATVSNNADPDQEGKIQVTCVGLMGDDTTTMPNWIEPNLDWGWFYVPDVGETVEIEMAIGSDTDESRGQTSLDTPDITWRGKRRWTGEDMDGQNEPRPIPEVFKENYGKRRGFTTPAGHTVLFDDTEGKERLEIIWAAGDKSQSLLMDETGSVKATDSEGQSAHLDAKNKKIIISDANDQTVTMEADLIKVVGAKVVEVEAETVNLKSGDVNVGDGADNAIMRAEDFIAHMDVHTHATAMGPSGPPLAPTPASAKSTTAKVK